MKKNVYLLIAISTLFLIACEKFPELKVYELEVSGENVVVTQNGVTITANYWFPTEIYSIKVLVNTCDNMNNAVETVATLKHNSLTNWFTATIENLSVGTKHYYCLRYSNGIESVNTEVKSFTTLGGAGDGNVPTGAINGLFSVSDTQWVYFSKGNLQYQASNNKWRFADSQYDCVGSNNINISSSYDGWIDLFGWGTSGFNHGAVCYQPWSTSTENSDYYAYGSFEFNLDDQTGMADWGYNAISNGGNTTNMWRTLTNSEWIYVLNTRITTFGLRFAKASVNGVKGMILLPDNWSSSYYSLKQANDSGASYSSNFMDASEWSILEQHGAIFLPAAGYRNLAAVYSMDSYGGYWSASYYGVNAYYMNFNGSSNHSLRFYGRNVRLVCDAGH